MKDPDTGYGLEGDEINVGASVEICPGYDLWMQGARTGTIKRLNSDGTVMVKMDHRQVKVNKRFPVDRLKYLGQAPYWKYHT